MPDPRRPLARSEGRTLVVVSPSGEAGGAETMLLRAAQAAQADGWQVRCLVPEGPLARDLRACGADVRVVPPLRVSSRGRARAAATLARAVVQVAVAIRAAARDADVVLANGLLVLPALRLTPRGAARVWWAHDVLVRGDRLRVARWCATVLDQVVGVSDAVLAPLRGSGPPLVVVRNGVDGTDVRVDRPDSGPPTIGCVAALTPWKGQHVLLEAVAQLARSDVRVELLGVAPPKDAPYEAALRERAARPDLDGRVEFAGQVVDPLQRMRHWHVGVSASTDPEASGLGVLEGLSLGLPQVVTSGGGPAEVLDGAGLVVAPGDPSAMTPALRRLLDDRALWDRCSAAGPQVVAANGHRPSQERALLNVLAAAADHRGERSRTPRPSDARRARGPVRP